MSASDLSVAAVSAALADEAVVANGRAHRKSAELPEHSRLEATRLAVSVAIVVFCVLGRWLFVRLYNLRLVSPHVSRLLRKRDERRRVDVSCVAGGRTWAEGHDFSG